MLTKGAIGNLINRYRAVLKKCKLINTFGSLAMASMLVMGSAGAASATDGYFDQVKAITTWTDGVATDVTKGGTADQLFFGGSLAENGKKVSVANTSLTLSGGKLYGELNAGGAAIGAGA